MSLRLLSALVGSLLAVPMTTGASSMSAFPPSGGDGGGDSSAFDAGFAEGLTRGSQDAVAACQVDPLACGISLGACLAAPSAGETEPNDNMVTADALVEDTKFWGQSYGLDDQDWFYFVTSAPNQTLTLNFSVANGLPRGWQVAVRDAAGSVLGRFNTGSVPGATSEAGDITYRMTLGLVGTYYISIRPDPAAFSFDPYTLAVLVEDSTLDSQQFVAGFVDVETEPNDVPPKANLIASGVTVFGLINLNLPPQAPVAPDPDGDGFVYLQGEDDWFEFWSNGNELVSLALCDRTECGPGQWLVQVFTWDGAHQTAQGNSDAPPPLLAFNTLVGTPTRQMFGIRDAGSYFIRIGHRRLLTATCVGYGLDINGDGRVDGPSCSCEQGAVDCSSDQILSTADESPIELIFGPPTDTGAESAEDEQPEPAREVVAVICPNGQEGRFVGIDENGVGFGSCSIDCRCTQTQGQILMPENDVTSAYNFTLFSTQVPAATVETDAYLEFLSRPSPF